MFSAVLEPCLIISLYSWHHGAISRDEAEDLLRGKPDGVYLVRDSVHFHGDFTLSISCDSRIDHYRILTKNNELEVDGGDCTFDNLIQLVEVGSCDFLKNAALFVVSLYCLFLCCL